MRIFRRIGPPRGKRNVNGEQGIGERNATGEVRDREDAGGGQFRKGQVRAPRRHRPPLRRQDPRPEADPRPQDRRSGNGARQGHYGKTSFI